AELVARAFRVAMQGRPGPVVVALPEDVLPELAAAVTLARIEPAVAAPAPADMVRLADLLAAAERPLIVLGGSGWDQTACERVATFAADLDLPVATSFRRASLFAADHPCYAGDLGVGPDPRLKTLVTESDLILLLGGRMSEMPSSSYT